MAYETGQKNGLLVIASNGQSWGAERPRVSLVRGLVGRSPRKGSFFNRGVFLIPADLNAVLDIAATYENTRVVFLLVHLVIFMPDFQYLNELNQRRIPRMG